MLVNIPRILNIQSVWAVFIVHSFDEEYFEDTISLSEVNACTFINLKMILRTPWHNKDIMGIIVGKNV